MSRITSQAQRSGLLGPGLSRTNSGPVAESIAVLVHPTRELVVQGNPVHAEFRERVEFIGLGDAVVISIDP